MFFIHSCVLRLLANPIDYGGAPHFNFMSEIDFLSARLPFRYHMIYHTLMEEILAEKMQKPLQRNSVALVEKP
jgi:hypothetical protein